MFQSYSAAHPALSQPSGPHHPCGTWGERELMQRPPNNGPGVKVSDEHSTFPTICRYLILLSIGKTFSKINSKRFLTPSPSLPCSPQNLVWSVNATFPRKSSSPLGHLLDDDWNNMGGELYNLFQKFRILPWSFLDMCLFLSPNSNLRPAWLVHPPSVPGEGIPQTTGNFWHDHAVFEF